MAINFPLETATQPFDRGTPCRAEQTILSFSPAWERYIRRQINLTPIATAIGVACAAITPGLYQFDSFLFVGAAAGAMLSLFIAAGAWDETMQAFKRERHNTKELTALLAKYHSQGGVPRGQTVGAGAKAPTVEFPSS